MSTYLSFFSVMQQGHWFSSILIFSIDLTRSTVCFYYY
nr:MAG TPA: hypothetical protein [Caudoviricetes sp.]